MQNNEKITYIKEVFKSIQGEGPYVGVEQIFIRFCKCNLACAYCDTNFRPDVNTPRMSTSQLKEYLEEIGTHNIHSISLTGGEPLLDAAFIKEFSEKLPYKIYLETNGTLSSELKKVIKHISFISMDIKLDSSTKLGNMLKKHKEFIKICVKNKKEIFLKVVFDESITNDEIDKCIELAEKYKLLIVLQPVMIEDKMRITPQELIEIHSNFIKKYGNIRLIPQVHKFIKVE